MEIYDFDQYEIGTKKYGGSDTKFSLEIDGIFYMLKQPTEIRNPTKIQEKYSNTCISEYLACHIYEILGFETQHTFLGNFTCHDGVKRLCVACEDFTDNPNYASEGLFLQHFNDYSHDFNRTANEFGFKVRNKSDEQKKYGYMDEIEEILDNDIYLKEHSEIKDKFYDMFVVDSVIANRDRHYFNWGFLTSIHPYGDEAKIVRFAPIYDCGATMYPEATEEFLIEKTHDRKKFENEIKRYPNSNNIEVFKEAENESDRSWLKRIDYYSYMNSLKNDNLNKAIKRMFPIIEEKLPDIYDLINDMVDSEVISEERGECYKKIIDGRFTLLVYEPFYKLEKIEENTGDEVNKKDDGMEME